MFDLTPEESVPYARRITAMHILITLMFVGVGLAYWRIQVIQGSEFMDEAVAISRRELVLRPPRGIMLDRDGVLLVDSRPSYDAVVMREDVGDESEMLRRAAPILRLSSYDLKAYQARARTTARFLPLTLKADLSLAEISFIQSRRGIVWRDGEDDPFQGIDIAREPRRNYVGGELMAHVLGYVGEVSENELDQPAYKAWLRPGDVVGRSGIEAFYNKELTGRHGGETIVVDSHGRQHGDAVERNDPTPGYTLHTALDIDLQRVAKAAFEEEGYNGAAVVIDPRNGEVMVLMSEPSFDPNLFSVRIPRAEWNRLQGDPDHPLQNRAIQSHYPPGSTFKLLETVAGLEEGILTPHTARSCGGANMYFGRAFKCHKKGGHGAPDLRMAIQKSCNGYFYSVGNQLGIERIAKWGRLFGLGRPTGIDLPNENAGILPCDEWKRKALGEKWYPGETISVAIGQGYVQLTPVQLASMYATIANGGTVWRPHIVRAIYDLEGRLVKEVKPQVMSRVPMKPENVAFVHDALWSVVNEWGTARAAQIPGRDVCGKTGTAQVTAASAGTDAERIADAEMRDHAWFAGFAPRDNPEIAFCVFVEHGGHGGIHSAPIAKKILEAYFAKKERQKPAVNVASL